MSSYLRPTELEQALRALSSSALTIVAGGTDFYPARVGKPIDEDILDVTAIRGLRSIDKIEGGWFVGATTTWTDLARADLPGWFRSWKMAAREVGGVQIQNAGTMVGNVCNASPAADGTPCLIAMDASVRLASLAGERDVAVAEFVTGNRRTLRRPDEMVLGLVIPDIGADASSTFLKLGARKYLVISIAMIAAILEPAEDGTVARCRIAVGSCSEVAKRLSNLESELVGHKIDAGLADIVTPDHLSGLSPIDDVRGTGDYRQDAALTLVRRALAELTDIWGMA